MEVGAKALMSIGGVGKLSPNMVLVGFKKDWRTDMDGLDRYMNILYNAFDMNFSVGILRVKKGLDYSSVSITSLQVFTVLLLMLGGFCYLLIEWLSFSAHCFRKTDPKIKPKKGFNFPWKGRTSIGSAACCRHPAILGKYLVVALCE